MRISDWSSDVCSSDLCQHGRHDIRQLRVGAARSQRSTAGHLDDGRHGDAAFGRKGLEQAKRRGADFRPASRAEDERALPAIVGPRVVDIEVLVAVDERTEAIYRYRKRGVSGKSVSIRVALGGQRCINKKRTDSRILL